MGRRKRRTFTTAYKTKDALEALKERKTLAELASVSSPEKLVQTKC